MVERITKERLKELASWSPGGRTDTLSATRDEWKEMARELLAYREAGALEAAMENKAAESLGAPDSLKKNLDWYIANQKELAARYNGKVLLIVDQKLIKVFDDMAGAYRGAAESYAPGTFTLQPCSPDADSYTLMLYSPMYSILA